MEKGMNFWKGLIQGETPEKEPMFPLLTKEDMNEIYLLYLDILVKFGPSKAIPGFQKYSGVESIGAGSPFFNTEITKHQFVYALAMTRHPLVKELAKETTSPDSWTPEEMVKEKIMQGLKVLDLGSSGQPVFARCSRALGAEVWTVDKDPVENDSNDMHIQVNLGRKDIVDIIEKKSGGNFNLVTAANLDAAGFSGGKKIGWPLVKKGGVYYEVSAANHPELKEN